MLRLGILLSCLIIYGLLPTAGSAKSLHSLKNGINRIDLNADARKDIIVRAKRENYNAHSYHILTFYSRNGDDRLTVIPVEKPDDSDDGYIDMLTTHHGADCTIRDFALINGDFEGAPRLIRAERPLDNGYAAKAQVRFTIYALVRNKQNVAGTPDRYFAVKSQEKTDKHYCDVGKALGDYVE